ncbi:MAG: hypothetical protein ACOZQL_19255 [Myxococcota bacterium]
MRALLVSLVLVAAPALAGPPGTVKGARTVLAPFLAPGADQIAL